MSVCAYVHMYLCMYSRMNVCIFVSIYSAYPCICVSMFVYSYLRVCMIFCNRLIKDSNGVAKTIAGEEMRVFNSCNCARN